MSAPAGVPSNDDVAWPDDAVEVGRIVDAWGVKGWIKVQPYSADPQALFSSRRWFIQLPDTPRPAARRSSSEGAASVPRLLKITQAREHGDWVVASAQELSDRTAAEMLKGARVFVSRSSFPTADEDEYYWVDLIGLEVVNREGTVLGRVTDLIDTGPHCVLRLQDDSGAEPVERLVPFVSAYIDAVDLPGRRIVADWGLDY